uniref:Venom redulysin 1 n=1 Tax=Oncocephalus sp. TaxID=2944721 RepID=A0AB38ZEG0_9HEMI
MSKIWILLLLVGVVQYINAYPTVEENALEEGFEDDVLDDYPVIDFDDLSDEERGKVGDWFKDKWQKMKTSFKKVGAKLKAAFNKGRAFLKKKGIKIDPLNCKGTTCNSCVSFTLSKKKFCIKFTFSSTELQVTLTRQKDDQEPEAIFPPFKIPLGKVSTCVSMGKFLGKLCMQGVEGRFKSSDGKPHMTICCCGMLKTWNIGMKMCLLLQNGKFNMKFTPLLFPGDEENGVIMEAGEKEDEGKPVDAVPE